MKRAMIRILFGIVISLLALDGLLHLFDPWGAIRYAQDSRILFLHIQADPVRGYKMEPGVYHFSTWQATILPDGNRAVPDTNVDAKCTIALLGDSATFGYGISDNETWANLMAIQFPNVHIVNTGVNGYNIENVWQTLQATPANGYFYMMIGNDADGPYTDWKSSDGTEVNTGLQVSTTALYIEWLFIWDRMRKATPIPVRASFYETLDKLNRSDVKIVSFPFDLTYSAIAHGATITVLNLWSESNSRVDPHPNAKGTREIATEIKPIFAELANKVCGG